jgi:hypothetical protein
MSPNKSITIVDDTTVYSQLKIKIIQFASEWGAHREPSGPAALHAVWQRSYTEQFKLINLHLQGLAGRKFADIVVLEVAEYQTLLEEHMALMQLRFSSSKLQVIASDHCRGPTFH